MVLFSSIPCIAVFIAIIVANLLSAVFSKRLSLVFSLLGIALSLAIVPMMLFCGCPLQELALVYMAALLAAVLPIFIKRRP